MSAWVQPGTIRPALDVPRGFDLKGKFDGGLDRSGSRWEPLDVDRVSTHLERVDVQETIADAVDETGPHRNLRMEEFGVEAARDYYQRTEGMDVHEVGGKALPDGLAIDPMTDKLAVIEFKGTGVDSKRWSDLGLINEKRVENSPDWLDKNTSRLLEKLQTDMDAASTPELRADLEQVKGKVEEIQQNGGFGLNPESYRNDLYVAGRHGAFDPSTSEARQTLSKYAQETGCGRVVIDEAPGSFVDRLLAGDR